MPGSLTLFVRFQTSTRLISSTPMGTASRQRQVDREGVTLSRRRDHRWLAADRPYSMDERVPGWSEQRGSRADELAVVRLRNTDCSGLDARCGQESGRDREHLWKCCGCRCGPGELSSRFPGSSRSPQYAAGRGFAGLDLGLDKRWKMPWKESHSLQFRWEVFNALNLTRFDVSTLNTSITNVSTFGDYSGLVTNPRTMQFALRYEF